MTKRQQQALAIFRRRYPMVSAAAIVGAISGESGVDLNSDIHRVNADHDSGGIAEWRLDRKVKLVAFAKAKGADPDSLEIQCEFLIHELDTDQRYVSLNAQLMNPGSRTVGNLTANFVEIFERPDMSVAHLDFRIDQANKVLRAAQITKNAKGGVIVAAGTAGGAVMTRLHQGPGLGSTMLVIAAIVILVVVASAIGSLYEHRPVSKTPAPSTPPPPSTDPLDRLKKICERLSEIGHETNALLAEKDEIVAAVKARAEEFDKALAALPAPKTIEHSQPQG